VAISAIFAVFLLSGFSSRYCDTHHLSGSAGIRSVDFCNFLYPGVKSEHKRFGWPNTSFRLEKGVHEPENPDGGGLITLEKVQYADITHNGQEGAVTTMIWHSGGTMQLGIVYVWSFRNGTPVMLWNFVGGDRGLGGLRRAYAEQGDLFLEVYDSNAAEGNCCSRRIVRTHYRWNGSTFVQTGKRQTLANPDYEKSD